MWEGGGLGGRSATNVTWKPFNTNTTTHTHVTYTHAYTYTYTHIHTKEPSKSEKERKGEGEICVCGQEHELCTRHAPDVSGEAAPPYKGALMPFIQGVSGPKKPHNHTHK